MSNTFTAGQKLRAVDMIPQKLWTVTATTNSSSVAGTPSSETVMYSSPSATYRAGRAYRMSLRFRANVNTGASDHTYAIRDTNASGTFRMGAQSYRVAVSTLNTGIYIEHIVANTTTSDITGRVLALTLIGSTNTNLINASASCPFYWGCYDYGDADDFPEAVAL